MAHKMATWIVLLSLHLILIGLPDGAQSQEEKKAALKTLTAADLVKERRAYTTSGAVAVYPAIDSTFYNKEECCQLEDHVIPIGRCLIKTKKCSGGCKRYSKDSNPVYIVNGQDQSLAQLCPGEDYSEGKICCVPKRIVKRTVICGKFATIYQPVECDCGPCELNDGNCKLVSNIRQVKVQVSPNVVCYTDKIDLPYCAGTCHGSESYVNGYIIDHIGKFSNAKKAGSCCESDDTKMETVKVWCEFTCFGFTISYSKEVTITKIASCDCQRCQLTLPISPTVLDVNN